MSSNNLMLFDYKTITSNTRKQCIVIQRYPTEEREPIKYCINTSLLSTVKMINGYQNRFPKYRIISAIKGAKLRCNDKEDHYLKCLNLISHSSNSNIISYLYW